MSTCSGDDGLHPAPSEKERQVIEALKVLRDSGTDRPLLELGWITEVRVRGERAVFRLALPNFASAQRDRLAAEARGALLRQAIPGVRQVIAVSSGKGGVGKSTVAVNLACALARNGLRVGLLDADIYGPNAPTMLGVADQVPEVRGSGSDQVLRPIETCGLVMVSMGLLIADNQPVIWRGPMLNGIIRQFLYQVDWGELDVLVVDLPPGTGDAQLSLAQAVPIGGGLVVTTPQRVSLQDARRGLAMFVQMGVPVLGVVENMSWFLPPDQPDRRYALFGSGGGALLADEAGVPLLAQLPLELPVREGGDEGRPIVLAQPESATAKAFRGLAEAVSQALALQGAAV